MINRLHGNKCYEKLTIFLQTNQPTKKASWEKRCYFTFWSNLWNVWLNKEDTCISHWLLYSVTKSYIKQRLANTSARSREWKWKRQTSHPNYYEIVLAWPPEGSCGLCAEDRYYRENRKMRPSQEWDTGLSESLCVCVCACVRVRVFKMGDFHHTWEARCSGTI